VLREANIKEVPKEDMDAIVDEAMEEGEVDPKKVLIVERLVMFQYFLQKHVLSVGTITSLSTLRRIFLTY
jgi:hypothetical protein